MAVGTSSNESALAATLAAVCASASAEMGRPDDEDDVSGAGSESALVECGASLFAAGLPRVGAPVARADRADAVPPLNVAACNRLRLSTGRPGVPWNQKKKNMLGLR